MREYVGWSVYDKVVIVIKEQSTLYEDIPQAYIVNPSDKKQMNSALNWAQGRNNAKVKVIETSNDNFKLTLLDSARNSYQGGKLSFWNCLIEKKSEKLRCAVGISADILLTLLMQNKFEYGYLDKPVMFARKQGNLGVITKDMKEYKEAQKDKDIRKAMSQNKTSKWIPGYNYVTPTLDETYIGCVYVPLKMDYILSGFDCKSTYDYELKLNKDRREHRAVHTNCIKDKKIKSMSDLCRQTINEIDIMYNEIKQTDKIKSKYLDKLIVHSVLLSNEHTVTNKEKLPSRTHGQFELKQDMSIEEVYTKVINHLQERAVELIRIFPDIKIYHVENFIIKLEDTKTLNENEKILLAHLLKVNKVLNKL